MLPARRNAHVSLSTRRDDLLDEDRAWALLRALAHARNAPWFTRGACVALNHRGELERTSAAKAWIQLRDDLPSSFEARRPLRPRAETLLATHMPLCTGSFADAMVVAHLGQSLDGRVAAAEGHADRFITGDLDILHTHQLRALCDAIVVGANTVAVDDPQLTTRLCTGASPVRVIIDTHATLAPGFRGLRDSSAPTVLATAHPERISRSLPAHVSVLSVPAHAGALDLRALLARLSSRGLRRIYIEGGGVTVARFLRLGLVDRLQLVVAPKVLGDSGAGLELPSEALAQLRFSRRLSLGDDVLYEWSARRHAAREQNACVRG